MRPPEYYRRLGQFEWLPLLLLTSFTIVLPSIAFGGVEWILWERIKIEPEIAVRQTYDDNIYLTDSDEVDDSITSVIPSIDTRLAFSRASRLFFIYSGLFNFYNDADNFQEDHHYANTGWQYETGKGSTVEIGVWGEDTANQPFGPDDRSRPYTIGSLYADLNVNVNDITDVFGSYQHSVRSYEETVDQQDDYVRDYVSLGLVHSRSTLFPWLLEYRYFTQENDDSVLPPSEFTYQAGYTGFRWSQDQRLSGRLQFGYLRSDFNGTKAYEGLATDIDLFYSLGPSSRIRLRGSRGVRESTRAARETLDYYVYAGGGLSLDYTRFDPFQLNVFGRYENRDFRSINVDTDLREDDLFIAGITGWWRFKDWLSVSLGYRHRLNDSNVEQVSYRENRLFAEVIFLSTGQIRGLRKSTDPSRINYF